MRIPSGTTDQYIYFVAVDATDLKTRETGLSSFTVYRSRNGAAAAAMTTPTVTEVDSTNAAGLYQLLCDEDMTIGSGNDSEEMAFHITASGMHPVTRTIELYRPKITAGYTFGVNASGHGSRVTLVDTTTANTDMRGTDSANTTTPPTAAAVRAEMDSNSTQLADIVADTNELQTDWTNGGRLDGLLDKTLAFSTDRVRVFATPVMNQSTISRAFIVDAFTYDENGALANVTTFPTFSATGDSSGDRSGDFGGWVNVGTGHYQNEYTVGAIGLTTVEGLLFAVSAPMSDGTFIGYFRAAIFPEAPSKETVRAEIDSNSTEMAKIVSRSGFTMSILAGAISNADNAAEQYAITLDTVTYTVTYTGLDTDGNRGASTALVES